MIYHNSHSFGSLGKCRIYIINSIDRASDLCSTGMPEPMEHSSSYTAQDLNGIGFRV